MGPNLSVQREWADMEKLRGSGNREYAKVIPRRATLGMETKTELEAQVFNKLGSGGGRQHTVVSSWDSGNPANGIFRGCRRW